MKKWLIIAGILVMCGLLAFTVIMSLNNWDFTVLSTKDIVKSEHEITEDFKNIRIKATTGDVRFVVSEDGKSKVVISEFEGTSHTVCVENNTLRIDCKDNRKWYEHIGINIGSPKITVYVSDTILKEVDIETTTGDITLDSYLHINDLNIDVTTGDITLTNIRTFGTDITVTTGDIKLTDSSCLNTAYFKTTTGDIKFDCFFAENIEAETTTGDVTGILHNTFEYIVDTTTGDIDVPENKTGGICRITTTTGDIKIEHKPLILT